MDGLGTWIVGYQEFMRAPLAGLVREVDVP